MRTPLLIATRNLFEHQPTRDTEYVGKIVDSILILLKYGCSVNVEQLVDIQAPWLKYPEPRLEHPLVIAASHCLLPIMMILWEAGSEARHINNWFKNDMPKYEQQEVQ